MEHETEHIFERQGVPLNLRSEEHFFIDCSKSGDLYAIPREILIQGETYDLLETGGAVSKDAVVTNSEIGPRSIIKMGSLVLDSTIDNYIVENSVVYEATLKNTSKITESRVVDSSVSLNSHINSSDVYASNIGHSANIGQGSSIQDSDIGDNFTLGAHSYVLGDAPSAQYIRGGKCVIRDNVSIGFDATIHAGVTLDNNVTLGSAVKIDEYSEIKEKSVVEDFVKIGSCTRIGKESYLLNRVLIGGGKQISDRTFVYHTKQDTDYETMRTRFMFRNALPFEHNLRAPFNSESFEYDTYWLISDKKRPY